MIRQLHVESVVLAELLRDGNAVIQPRSRAWAEGRGRAGWFDHAFVAVDILCIWGLEQQFLNRFENLAIVSASGGDRY